MSCKGSEPVVSSVSEVGGGIGDLLDVGVESPGCSIESQNAFGDEPGQLRRNPAGKGGRVVCQTILVLFRDLVDKEGDIVPSGGLFPPVVSAVWAMSWVVWVIGAIGICDCCVKLLQGVGRDNWARTWRSWGVLARDSALFLKMCEGDGRNASLVCGGKGRIVVGESRSRGMMGIG